MGWGRLDDNLDDHPKFLALLDCEEEGYAAITLWTLTLAWANRNTRKQGKVPGLLPAGLPRRYLGPAGRAAAALLVEVALWETADDGGWMIHDFNEYLPSETTRKARAEAGRKGAEARWRGKKAGTSEAAADGNEPSPGHSKSHSGSHEADGNKPSASHGVAGEPAGKPMATDGSRAHARRGPTPSPEPGPSPTPTPPRDRQAAQTGPDASRAPRREGGRRAGQGQGRAEPHGDAQVIHMGLVAEIQALRPEWSAAAIRRALEHPAVGERPADLVRAAFLLVAADPDTEHPGRLAHDGPWWTKAARQARPHPAQPNWCGRCESPQRRMVELPDGRMQRCPECHPLTAQSA
ncbi:hypothetical protein [Actinomadura litoris]|uniref:hypothetical protein n=1 Tax=Actinomadura litoris TaxID=2678616 RepID=UPI001FA77814|nr:hypothetical protein [Actinomadura litoris]